MNTATETQLATIRARRVDAAARAMMASGVTLTHAQADELGNDALDWIASRLDLRVRTTDGGVVCEVTSLVLSKRTKALQSARCAASAAVDEAVAAYETARAACKGLDDLANLDPHFTAIARAEEAHRVAIDAALDSQQVDEVAHKSC